MKTLLLATCLIFGLAAHAQTYVFSTFTDGYSELTNPTVYTDDPAWDDPQISINLPFTFQMGTISIQTLEQIGLGAEWAGFAGTSASFISYDPDVIAGQNAEGAAPSEIAWKTEGAMGNRIFKIQYKDAAFYEEVSSFNTAENRVNFQFWLYEAGDVIEYRFGPSNIVDPELAYYGAPGPLCYIATDVDLMTDEFGFLGVLTGNPEDPTMFLPSSPEEIFDAFLDGTPADGRVYRFSPAVSSADNAQNEAFSLYPTIAEQDLTLRGDIAPGALYHIVSLDGRIVASGVLSSNTVDVSSLASGTYLLQIDDFGKAQKFVKR